MRRIAKVGVLAGGLVMGMWTSNAGALKFVTANVMSITQFGTVAGNNTVIRLNANLGGSGSSCSPAGDDRKLVVFDSTTAQGKSILSLATAALLSGRQVLVNATSGACFTMTTPNYSPPYASGQQAFPLYTLELL